MFDGSFSIMTTTNKVIPYWLDKCPVCSEPCTMACRCPRNDRFCKNNHIWERDDDGRAWTLDKGHGNRIKEYP